MKKVIIIHGYFASPYDHWFPWLQEKIHAMYDIEVEVLRMPNSAEPKVEAWLNKLREKVGTPTNETFIIAHSLGSMALLRYLDSLQESFTLGGMVLVSPFDKPLDAFPILDSFVDVSLDYEKLARNTLQKHVIFSDNDMYVPPHVTKNLSAKLDCALFEIPRGGHFLGIEGFETFPELFEIVKQMITKY